MFEKIVLIVLIIIATAISILGILLWLTQNTAMVYRFKRLKLKQKDVYPYVRTLGMIYMFLGVSLLPILIITVLDWKQYENVAELIFSFGLLTAVISHLHLKRKYRTFFR
ncbi:MAG: hypothetical protein K0R34_2566 [Herbinix sp.]|jgi:uncharacterized membrane protein|nr:hypothetical protein [Herbinix sp.]